MSALRPICDWWRERRIAALSKQTKAHMVARRHGEARSVLAAMNQEIKARSPQQVARMERIRGLSR